MDFDERAVSFQCHGDWLYGILTLPHQVARYGVVVVVGGPQYRAGSHRQFTLLARHLAMAQIAVMRFDYRGMGDSEGETRGFELAADDLRTAIDVFIREVPQLDGVVLWGLCDAASLITTYAHQDSRVAGLVLLNPWVRTAGGIARTTLKHYYRARLFDPGLWRKLLAGRFDFSGSLRSMTRLALTALRSTTAGPSKPSLLPERMRMGLRAFAGPVLIIVSGADLTAREFCDLAAADPVWESLLDQPKVTRFQLDRADHTFSRRAWRDQVAAWTREWLHTLAPPKK